MNVAALFAINLHMTLSYAYSVIMLCSVDHAKINGNDKDEDSLSVLVAIKLHKPEIQPGKNLI